MQTVAHKSSFSSARRFPSWSALRQMLGKGGPPRLDLESLPDHLKRDLGLLGGRDAPRRDLLRD